MLAYIRTTVDHRHAWLEQPSEHERFDRFVEADKVDLPFDVVGQVALDAAAVHQCDGDGLWLSS
jgi:hypothetical protein